MIIRFNRKFSKINIILNKQFDFRIEDISHSSILEEKTLIEENTLDSEEISSVIEEKSKISDKNQEKENSVNIKPERKDLKNFQERLKV